MKESKDNIKFWTVLAGIILAVSVTVLLIDMSIKAAILEESNALRRVLLGVQDDRSAKADSDGANHDSSRPGSILGEFSAGMEAGNVSNGNQETARKASNSKRSQARGRSNSGDIPEGD